MMATISVEMTLHQVVPTSSCLPKW